MRPSFLSDLTLCLLTTCLLTLCLAVVSVPALAKAKKTVFAIKGKQISVEVERLAPAEELTATARSKNPVVDLYFRYQQLLGEGKVAEAAQLTASPEADLQDKKAYADRLGGPEALQEQMKSVLTMHIRAGHVLRSGDEKMLLAKHPQFGYSATFYHCVQEACKIARPTDAAASGDLAEVFGQIRLGKIKL